MSRLRSLGLLSEVRLTEGDRVRWAVAANRQQLADSLVRHLLRFDSALSGGDLAEARSVMDSLARMRDTLHGKYRQEVQLMIDAKWEQLNNARRSGSHAASRAQEKRPC